MKNIYVIVLPALQFLSCEEQLPAYEDPQDLFAASIHGDYMYRTGDNAVQFYLTLVNTYDETLADTTRLNGSLSVTLARDPSFTRTFDVTAAELFYARSYNSGTRELIVDPGDSIVFRVRYNFMDDQGRLAEDILRMRADPDCGQRRVSENELFLVRGGATIFNRIVRSNAPTLGYPICYVNPFISNKTCEDVNGPLDNCL